MTRAGVFAPAVVGHVISSPFVGGPERQILGLAASSRDRYRTVLLPFDEDGRGDALADAARRVGCDAVTLQRRPPHFAAMLEELAAAIAEYKIDLLVTHHYKGDIVGRLATLRTKTPVVSVSHGWTGDCRRQCVYDFVDRFALRFMDTVVCVSEAQARRVRSAGVAAAKIVVVPNAVDPSPNEDSGDARSEIERLFSRKPRLIIGAAGRLSVEKGFDRLVEIARLVLAREPEVGFVVFGDGTERARLDQAVAAAGIGEQFVFAGFRTDLARFFPAMDVVALSSRTEGMPVVVLEAMAAGKPVVATAVGGTPEVVVEGATGFLAEDGDNATFARRLLELIASAELRSAMGAKGQTRMAERFTFEAQSRGYDRVFERVMGARSMTRPAFAVRS